mgnify:CR=1 FL=1
MGLRDFLKYGLSFGAVAASQISFAEAEQRKADPSYGERPTPRKPERRKAAPVADPRRAKKRRIADAIYRHRLAREREVGVNPKYRHGHPASRAEIANWAAGAREWDRANPVAVDA